MLPLSVRLRVTSPKFDHQVPDSERWAAEWAGFRLDGPRGRLGTIEAVGFDPATGEPAWLHVRTGLFVRRTVAIPFEDIESIEPILGRVTVTTAAIST
jgi:PRC-barrel domain protein